MKTYKMPSGEEAQDVDQYIDAWKAVAIPVCDMLNVRLCGFDPDFLLSSGEITINLPVCLAEKICQVAEENNRLRGALRWYYNTVSKLGFGLESLEESATEMLHDDLGERARVALGGE